MVCIFCLKEKQTSEFSNEHVFPEAIGGCLVIRTVCKPCNDYLGHSIDAHLMNHWFVQTQRLLLGLKGKADRLPNPFQQGHLSNDPTQKLVYILDDEGNPESLYVVPNIVREKLDGEREQISMRIDATDRKKIPSIIKKIRVRAGLPPLTTEEADKVQAQEQQSIPNPWMKLNAEIDLKHYQRALIKIAYELACTWLGSDYLNDPTGTLLRKCFLERSPDIDWSSAYPLNRRIDFIDGKSMFPMWQGEDNSHIAFIMSGDVELTCYVRVFQTFEGVLKVSSMASRYSSFHGRFMSIDPVMQTLRESSFSDELMRMVGNSG